MADIQYLNYGDLQIDLLALMTNMANLVLNYVNSQPWSSKRKNMFMSAYSDIIGHGILGASNNTGQWTIDVNGTDLNLSGKSKKEQEMYGEVAYFIQQLMQGLVSDAETKKEEEKKDLPLFDNAYFNKRLKETISKDRFGGGEILWGSLDNNERDSLGRRSVAGRTNQLIESLSKLSDSLKEGEYNFENSPYENLGDFKNRVNTAIEALKKDPYSAREALERLGLNYDTYLSTEENEDSGLTDKDGNPLTYAQYAEQLSKQEEAKLQLLALDALKKANALKGVLSITLGIHAVDARNNPLGYSNWLAQTYGVGQAGFNAVNNRILTLLNQAYGQNGLGKGLSSKDKKELGNLLYYIRQNNPNYQRSNITSEELAELRKHKNFSGSSNIIRLPWQTGGRYTYADDKGNIYYLKPDLGKKFGNLKGTDSNYKNNFLLNTPTGIDTRLQNYLKSTLFNDADIAELSGIALDIASIVDPEPITAAIAGVSAAGARNWARTRDPKDWTWKDWATQGFDYLTGAFGAIPIFGDAALATKTVANIAKWTKRAMTIPAIWDTVSHTPGALKALMKAVNGEDLTVEDWRNVGSFFRGLTATRHITGSNRAARRAMEKRGYDLSDLNSWVKRTGLYDTKLPTTASTVKVKIKGKEQEISITPEAKSKLESKLKEAGNNQTKKNDAVREALNEHITKNNLKPEEVTALETSHFRNARWFPRQIAKVSDNFGRSDISKPTGNDTFDSYLKDRSLWDRIKYGSNRNLRRYDPLKENPVSATTSEETNKPNTSALQPRGTSNPYLGARPNYESKNYSPNQIRRDLRNFEKGKFTNKDVEPGQIGNIIVASNKKGNYTIFELVNGKQRMKHSNLSKATLKKKMFEIMTNSSKVRLPNRLISNSTISQYKAKGWFKQGGKITDTQIDNFLKQYK